MLLEVIEVVQLLVLAGEKGAIDVADWMHLIEKVFVLLLPNPVITIAFIESCKVIVAVSEPSPLIAE
jgi:hypothetical protein